MAGLGPQGRIGRAAALAAAAVAIAVTISPGPAAAGAWTAGGWNFSDERGGFRILSVTGAGTVRDPIVIVEEITALGPAVLVIRDRRDRRSSADGRPAPDHLAASMIKIVFNRTGETWTGFELELREVEDQASPYQDGLSFDQMRAFNLPVSSNVFAGARHVDEPADLVRFWGGQVRHGGSVRFNFPITDPTVKAEFYLLQQPRVLIADRGPGRPVTVAARAAAEPADP
ncbi:MAG: hypothetical protein H6907_05800 [Hyphomicrobiales bacterium]|nr:hypothetical protein [Hyphomicrobiales bacterium]